MKILILTDKFPPERTTVGNIVLGIAHKMLARGHAVSVITTTRTRDEEKATEHEGVRVFRLYSDYHIRWQAYVSLYNSQTAKKVKEIIERMRPDVVHAHNIHHYLSYQCLKYAKESGAKVFLTAHDVMLFHYGKLTEYIRPDELFCPEEYDYKVSVWQQIKRFKKRYNPFRNMLIRHYLKYADKIFSVSGALKKALNQNDIRNVEVVHNGIDVEKWLKDEALIWEFKKSMLLLGKKSCYLAAG